MGLPWMKQKSAPMPKVTSPDLVGLIMAHYRDRIEPCQPSEVTDLADEFSHRYGQHITEREVVRAINMAIVLMED